MIVVVDYGVGNIVSVLNMLKRIGAKAIASKIPEDIERADKIILPGVGAFDSGMQTLRASGLIEVLNKQVLEVRKPVMGVCLGSQMLGNGSEEGREAGLGWIDMDTVRFEKRDGRKVPHMGWNEISPALQHPILTGIDQHSRFYFVHSYYMVPRNANNTLLTANYDQDFSAGVIKDNIFGFQFHPEKSHKFGMQLFTNFVELV